MMTSTDITIDQMTQIVEELRDYINSETSEAFSGLQDRLHDLEIRLPNTVWTQQEMREFVLALRPNMCRMIVNTFSELRLRLQIDEDVFCEQLEQ